LRQLNCSLEAEVAARIAERDRIWRLSLELLVVLDFDGVIRSANPAWEKVLGYPPQELSGQNVSTFIHPEDYLRTRGKLKSLRTASLPHTENRYRHRDGSWRWIAWTATAEDDLIYAVGRDITAEKHQAGMLAKTEEALRQAQKMEAVGQLTGGIAHDFNNLLQGISGGIELMHRRIADGRAHEAERFIETARKNIDRAAALTYRLLAFSRRQALSPRLVELDALIGGMGALIRQTVGPAITFEMRLMDGCWPICCDANQLENALLNLAINARDAMPDGGKLVIKTAHVVLSAADIAGVSGACPGEHVAITVTDTGTGMQDDVLRHAFEPFYTTKPAGQGTGLGLSQVYGFVTQSNGVVRLESEPGRGTSVHLYLPRHREKPLESEDPPSVVAAASGRGLAGAVIVLVEDEADLRAQACAALRECGCRVIEAADGPSGLNALRDALRLEADGIDMLVSDVGLPGGLNGRQLADAARALLPTLPVLLMTGYTGSLDATLPPGMAYLQKPFSLKNLVAAIETTIGGFA
jgi:PAS domain S-box-containing protein